MDVLRGLQFLHQKRIRHGDIKTGNIFVNKKNRAVLGDFGSLEHLERHSYTACALGTRTFDYVSDFTPGYDAPEVRNNEAVCNQLLMCSRGPRYLMCT
jgi:serine/threonine protein kinase